MENNIIGATGAVLNPPDNRDILLATVQARVTRPKSYITDISMIPVPNQLAYGTCVGQAEGGMKEYFDYKETGVYVPLSKRFLYSKCKDIDGIPSIQGTYPRVAAKVLFDVGIAESRLVKDDNTLPYSEYLKVDSSREVLDNAKIHRVGGYAFVLPQLEDLLQAIYQNGIVNVTFQFGDWGKFPLMPNPDPKVGSHRNYLYGYEEVVRNGIPDAKIYNRNSWGDSWGEKGNGWFYFNDYKNYLFDMMAYTDIPNQVIEEAKGTNYIFTRTLKYGMQGADVMELQKRLAKEVASDGLACFRYPTSSTQTFTTYFGKETEKAVQRYQEIKKIVVSGTPETTGFGQLGPTTRAALNGENVTDPKNKLKPRVEQMKNQLVSIMATIGTPIIVTEGFRSIERQNELYAQGRTKPGGIITNAKGGESFHNYGVAFDIAFSTKTGITYEGPWETVAKIGEALGLSWGGWPDRSIGIPPEHPSPVGWPNLIDKPHFEYRAGYTLQDFQKGNIDESKFGIY